MQDKSFFDSLEAVLERHGIDPQKRLSILEGVWMEWSGQQIYISLRGNILRRAIMASFDGTNAEELAHRFRISTNQVHKIVKQERQARPDQAQTSLLTM